MDEGGQLHDPAAFSLGKRPPYPLNRSLDRPQCWPGSFGKQKYFSPISGIKPLFLGRPTPNRTFIIGIVPYCGVRAASSRDGI